MEKKRKKGRKKGENNLTYLTLLELQDIRSPQWGSSFLSLKFHNNGSNKKERVWAWSFMTIVATRKKGER